MSILSHRDIVSFLQQRGLIATKSIVDGELLIEDISRRNRNFKVLGEHNECYLLKQGVGPSRIATITHEAIIYALLQSNNDRFVDYLPYFYEYDSENHILILELVHNAENLRDYHARSGHFSKTLAAETGKALAILHRSNRMKESRGSYHSFSTQPPWILSIHHPGLGVFREFSSANIQLIKILQQFTEFSELLDEIAEGWRTESLIHGDIKWDNCIAFSRSQLGKKTKLKIVDWELASWGDPCWDVGSVFADYLSFWLLSIPITGEVTPEDFPNLARYPLRKMHPALHAFWHSYTQNMHLGTVDSDKWLLRSVNYGATRLLQTAVEQMQMSLQLTGNVICFLQLSSNMLRRPHEAAVHLLGMPFG